jgi:acyl-homoserine lactone acylase PvdQ
MMETKRSWKRRCLILAVLFICGCSSLNSYQKQGNLRLAGLEAPVTVMRDEKGLGLVSDKRIMGYLADRLLEIGSNNWAVDADHSPGGKPILANDPHLDARILPGPLYPCGIITPDMRVVGVSPAGVPGMIVFRNAHVDLGLTNAYGDTQDLYVETIDPQDPDNYLEGDQPIPFEVIEESITIKDKNASGGFKEQKINISCIPPKEAGSVPVTIIQSPLIIRITTRLSSLSRTVIAG